MVLCGSKVSTCCTLLSVWGLVQLGVTGLCFYMKSPALVEDIPFREHEGVLTSSEMMTRLHNGYQQSALNCWIAALLYLVTLTISAHQLWSNKQSQEYQKTAQFWWSWSSTNYWSLSSGCYIPSYALIFLILVVILLQISSHILVIYIFTPLKCWIFKYFILFVFR